MTGAETACLGTCKYLVWKKEEKVATFLMMTFTYLSPFYLFYGGLCQPSGKWPETPGEPTGY
jgi:hypothetical protein